MTTCAAMTIVGLLTISSCSQADERISGQVHVIDGDTLRMDGQEKHIRLFGIDAPESKQSCEDGDGASYPCGLQAAQHLAGLIGPKARLSCSVRDHDRYGRTVADCSTPDGVDINAEMVRSGWAVEYRHYAQGRFDREEAEAKAGKRGIWAGRFAMPEEYRHQEGSQTAAAEESDHPPGCDIKGNISKSGRIYHMPGQADYEKTRIDLGSGERWFCDEQAASAAGWKKAAR